MKYIKSKCLQEAKGRKKGRYLITLEITDYDLEMLEDFATTYAPFKMIEEPGNKNNWNGIYSPDYKHKYQKWLSKMWRTFWIVWNKYDK